MERLTDENPAVFQPALGSSCFIFPRGFNSTLQLLRPTLFTNHDWWIYRKSCKNHVKPYDTPMVWFDVFGCSGKKSPAFPPAHHPIAQISPSTVPSNSAKSSASSARSSFTADTSLAQGWTMFLLRTMTGPKDVYIISGFSGIRWIIRISINITSHSEWRVIS